jgi:hypothetical protein
MAYVYLIRRKSDVGIEKALGPYETQAEAREAGRLASLRGGRLKRGGVTDTSGVSGSKLVLS